MSNFLAAIGWGRMDKSADEALDIFPFPMKLNTFIDTDVQTIYAKILTDVAERSQGLKASQVPLLFDSCLQSDASKGLISLLSKAMAEKSELFLVFKNGIVRKATEPEQTQIKTDYKASAKSSVGIYVSFNHYDRTDMVKLYSGLDYLVIASLHKSMNVSKAVQIKISELRGSVSLSDASVAEAQGKKVATALKGGKDVLLDAKDIVETAKPDVTATKEAGSFVSGKLSFYLGLPASYITGEQTGGIGSTGEGDTRAVERGLKNYYFSIFKPVVEALFGVQTSFKSQDFRLITSGLEALKAFALVDGEELITNEQKKLIVTKLLDLQDAKEDEK